MCFSGVKGSPRIGIQSISEAARLGVEKAQILSIVDPLSTCSCRTRNLLAPLVLRAEYAGADLTAERGRRIIRYDDFEDGEEEDDDVD